MGDLEFASADVYAFADTIYKLVKGKFLNACSVGFLPKKYSFSKDPSRPQGLDFLQQEIIECSVVGIPANANALAVARSKGFNGEHLRRIEHELTEREARIIRARKISAAATRALVLGSN